MKKLLVITGGSKGIGDAIIKKFAAMGFDIFTCARNESDLKIQQQSIFNINPKVEYQYLVADLGKSPDSQKFIDWVLSKNRSITILINNAGLYKPGQIHSEAAGSLMQMLHVNLISAYDVTRGLVPKMIAAREGHIFNMCSVASITPYVNGGSYCIAKFALLGMGKVLREEMKPYQIRVTNVLPGATKTGSWDGVDLPESRFINATDVADTIWSAYQLSPNAVIEEIVIRPQLGDI